MIEKGQIYYTDIFVDNKTYFKRPVLVLQGDMDKVDRETVLVAPITSNIKHKTPTAIYIDQLSTIRANSYVLLDKMRPVCINKLKGYVGKLNKNKNSEIDYVLKILLNIED